MIKTDLHIHSNFSDGTDSVKELAEKISKNGIKIFALTDHDEISGCKEIIKHIPEGIKFIPGIELTCMQDNLKCHILGLNCNPDDEVLTDLILKGKILRRIKLETRIKFLKEVHGIELTAEEKDWLYGRKSPVKLHFANILINRGLADDFVPAMKKYLSGCHTPNTRFTIDEAINAIGHSGGIPVWAHPLGGEGEVHCGEDEFMPKLSYMISKGIKGLECCYSRYDLKEIEFLKNCAKKYNLAVSAGSDYHGGNKNIALCTLNNEGKSVDAESITVLNLL